MTTNNADQTLWKSAISNEGKQYYWHPSSLAVSWNLPSGARSTKISPELAMKVRMPAKDSKCFHVVELPTCWYEQTSVRGSKSPIWRWVKKLIKGTEDRPNPFLSESFTHVCTYGHESHGDCDGPFCGALLKISRLKNSELWSTSNSFNHFKCSHPDSEIGKQQAALKAKKSEKIKIAFKNMTKRKHCKQTQLDDGHIKKKPKGSEVRKAAILTGQTELFLYGRSPVTQRFFQCPKFRKLLELVAGEDTWGHTRLPDRCVMYPSKLKEWSKERFKIDMNSFRKCFLDAYARGGSNAMAQIFHDGGTINHLKYQVIGIQFISSNWDRNCVFAIGFESESDGSAVRTADLIGESLANFLQEGEEDHEALIKKYIIGMVQDGAALKVAEHLGYDAKVCLMHETDKIGASAIGNLVRSRNHGIVNPFKDAQDLLKKVSSIANHFLNSTKNFECLKKIAKDNNYDVIRPIAANKTRISSTHSLLLSMLRNKDAINRYFYQRSSHESTDSALQNLRLQEWGSLVDLEAILNITAIATTLTQYERFFVGAFNVFTKEYVLSQLRKTKVHTYESICEGLKTNIPRRAEVRVNAMTQIGKIARTRAILEAERRWCGNETEDLSNASVSWTEADYLATMLDCRTLFAIPKRCQNDARDKLKEKVIELKKKIDQDRGSSDTEIGSSQSVEKDIWSARYPTVQEAPVIANDNEFDSIMAEWVQFCREIDWSKRCEAWKNGEHTIQEPGDVMKLIKVPVGAIYVEASQNPKLKEIVILARGYIGALMSESFCERCLSVANILCPKTSAKTKPEVVQMRVLSRINTPMQKYVDEFDYRRIAHTAPETSPSVYLDMNERYDDDASASEDDDLT